jgi:hypothetical protein
MAQACKYKWPCQIILDTQSFGYREFHRLIATLPLRSMRSLICKLTAFLPHLTAGVKAQGPAI